MQLLLTRRSFIILHNLDKQDMNKQAADNEIRLLATVAIFLKGLLMKILLLACLLAAAVVWHNKLIP